MEFQARRNTGYGQVLLPLEFTRVYCSSSPPSGKSSVSVVPEMENETVSTVPASPSS